MSMEIEQVYREVAGELEDKEKTKVKENGKTKEVRKTLLFTLSLLLFTSLFTSAAWAESVAEIVETGIGYESVEAAVQDAIKRAKEPGGGSTVRLLPAGGQVQEEHFPFIKGGFFPGADRALTLDLNGCELTDGTDGTDPIEIWPTNCVTIKNGKIKTFFGWRDLVRIYGTAEDTSVTFENVELYDSVIGPGHDDTENEPEAHVIVRIIGGNVAFTGSTSINDSQTSKTVYAVKVGNGHNERFSVGTVTFDTTGNIKGSVLLAGGEFVEKNVGTGSAIHYRYGRNRYSSYEDGKALDGEGNALFEARVGTLPEEGNDANDAGPLCKRREHAFAGVRSVDETVTLLKSWTPGLDVTVYAKLTVANGAQITLGEARLTEFGGNLDVATAFTDQGVTRYGTGPFAYAARGAVEPDVIRTSAGEFVLNFQLPEGETLTPQKVVQIEERDGVKVIGFQPPRGLLVRMAEPNGLNAVGGVENVRRAPVPEFAEGSETVTVDVFPWGADLAESVGTKIGELGGTVVFGVADGSVGSWGRIRATLPRGKVAALAAVGDVRRIRKPLRVELLNNVSRREMNMNVEAVYPAEPVGDTLGLTGEGQIVGHADTGIDANAFDDPEHPMHPDFNTTNILKIIMRSKTAEQDVAGHGTHTLGSIVGSGASSNGLYRGIAYGARAVTQVLGLECAAGNGDFGGGDRSFTDDPPWELADIYQETYDLGARVHSDSWGWESTFSYEEPCAKADLYVFEHPEMLVVISAGNSFDKYLDEYPNGRYATIIEPASGKNVLAVGAYGNYGDGRTYHNHMTKEENYVYTGELADFSSRGPASLYDPQRIKPDVCAPGIYVTSTHSRYDLDADHEKPYTVFSGTSMSSPLTAGAALLMREYLAKYERMDHPSSALLRAAFIGGAKPVKTYVTGECYMVPTNECGWGGVDVGNTLAPKGAMTLFADHVETNLVGGAEWTTTLNVTNSAVPLRIALAWTDYPAASPDVPALVNDYDLVVTDPLGRRVCCNRLDGEDRANPQETVFVDKPAAGVWTVTVRAYQVVVEGSVLGFYCRGAFAPNAGDEVQQRNDLMKSVKPGLRPGMGRNLAEVAAYGGASEAVRNWLAGNAVDIADFAASGSGAASFLLGLEKLLSDDAQARIISFEAAKGVLRLTFELRDAETLDLSRVKETYVKSIVRCAEDLGFKTEIAAEKTVSVDEGGRSLTVEIVLPSAPAAAFVRIVIPSVNG